MVLTNGYVIDGQHYNTHITGIPYTLNTSSNDGSWSEESDGINWNTDGGVRLGVNRGLGVECSITKTFHIPADVTVKVTANGVVNGTEGLWGTAKVSNTVTLTVGSSKVVEKTQKGKSEASWSCSSASASMSSSSNTIKCNSSYNMEKAKVVVKALHIEF